MENLNLVIVLLMLVVVINAILSAILFSIGRKLTRLPARNTTLLSVFFI